MTLLTTYARSLGAIAASSALLIASSLPSFAAADAAKEISTAAEHAGYAADATVIGTTYSHLHHTLNCLVGPKGAGFDAKEANPCAAMGNGAIPDTTDAATTKQLKSAVAKARAGLKAKDLAKAKADATDAQDILKKLM